MFSPFTEESTSRWLSGLKDRNAKEDMVIVKNGSSLNCIIFLKAYGLLENIRYKVRRKEKSEN